MYLQAYLQKSKHHSSLKALKDFVSAFEESFSVNPHINAEELARMARTMGTIKRRLGLSTSDLITTYTSCPTCFKRFSPEFIAGSDNPICTRDGCTGILYADKLLSTGKVKKNSTLTFLFASPVAWIQRMVTRDGIPELLQVWRQPQDQQLGPPVSQQEWYNSINLNSPLEDIVDGFGWRERSAGVQRVFNPDTGALSDQFQLDPPIRFCSLPFGLSLSMNVDW